MADEMMDYKSTSLFSTTDLMQFVRSPDAHGYLHRPPSSYNLFFGDCTKKLRKMVPSYPTSVLNRVIAYLWKKQKPGVKEFYCHKADAIKQIHKQKYPGFWLKGNATTKKMKTSRQGTVCRVQKPESKAKNFQRTRKLDKACQTDGLVTKFHVEKLRYVINFEKIFKEFQQESHSETFEQDPPSQDLQHESEGTESEQISCSNMESTWFVVNLEQGFVFRDTFEANSVVQVLDYPPNQLPDNSAHLLNL